MACRYCNRPLRVLDTCLSCLVEIARLQAKPEPHATPLPTPLDVGDTEQRPGLASSTTRPATGSPLAACRAEIERLGEQLSAIGAAPVRHPSTGMPIAQAPVVSDYERGVAETQKIVEDICEREAEKHRAALAALVRLREDLASEIRWRLGQGVVSGREK